MNCNTTHYRANSSSVPGDPTLLADNTPAAWRQALQCLVDDAGLRSTIAANARRHVFARRVLRHTARKWVTALRALAAPAEPVRPKTGSRPLRPGPRAQTAKGPVLVVVPGSVNYFYNRTGQRIAAAARASGIAAEVHTLRSVAAHEGGCVVLVNPNEVIAGHSDKEGAAALVRSLAGRHDRVAAVAMDCARTHWYTDLVALCDLARIDTVIDLGLVSQFAAHPEGARTKYRFLVNGLTAEERETVRRHAGPAGRPIPWLFVGHRSAERADLVARMVRDVDAGGFAYLPALSPVADGGPHIGERSFLAALGRAVVQVWCSHHEHFYMESERFRMSVLAGCLPVKAVQHPPAGAALLPFHYLMPTVADVPRLLREMDVDATWARFTDDYLSLPSLEDGIAEVLTAFGLSPGGAGPQTNGTHPKSRPVMSRVGGRR